MQKSNRTYHLSTLADSLPYVSDIICELYAFGRGCHVDGIYVGVLVYYADDLLLISSTDSDLHID